MPGMLRLANFSQCLALRQNPTRTLAPWPALSVRESMHCLLGSWQEDGSGAAEHGLSVPKMSSLRRIDVE